MKNGALSANADVGQVDFDVEEIGLSAICIDQPIDGGPGDVLRHFSADVLLDNPDGDERIGTFSGWVGWQIDGEDLADAGDHIDGLAYALGVVANEIVDDAHAEEVIETALLIEHIEVQQSFRGRRITRKLVEEAMRALRLREESTVVVLLPEPGGFGVTRLKDGQDRDAALTKLERACQDMGFKPWRRPLPGMTTDAWWLPIPSSSRG